ncbi:hypothetical protein K439DRAFT_1512217 [Ramaria rubella]|nr:hypothetical protein K439DRAFT_1512217 [Ramaria rubella]
MLYLMKAHDTPQELCPLPLEMRNGHKGEPALEGMLMKVWIASNKICKMPKSFAIRALVGREQADGAGDGEGAVEVRGLAGERGWLARHGESVCNVGESICDVWGKNELGAQPFEHEALANRQGIKGNTQGGVGDVGDAGEPHVRVGAIRRARWGLNNAVVVELTLLGALAMPLEVGVVGVDCTSIVVIIMGSGRVKRTLQGMRVGASSLLLSLRWRRILLLLPGPLSSLSLSLTPLLSPPVRCQHAGVLARGSWLVLAGYVVPVHPALGMAVLAGVRVLVHWCPVGPGARAFRHVWDLPVVLPMLQHLAWVCIVAERGVTERKGDGMWGHGLSRCGLGLLVAMVVTCNLVVRAGAVVMVIAVHMGWAVGVAVDVGGDTKWGAIVHHHHGENSGSSIGRCHVHDGIHLCVAVIGEGGRWGFGVDVGVSVNVSQCDV